ncbi:transcription antitermination factor NusB [Chelatococcus asaccharovorans]|uniref:Transcription antitermination protein NusB n=1 Tax=Chelatococcus asaccharovorans TaxID=28210 RepID=A0A2V3U640_9HYPH|nr:transcription antitermination factor NusB [Chelatococcus asaccharovorans]MBS7703798.1 transcription antitermination factor NusB [Chelatococcus asaccharovorans]PXW57958.1 NusB antitermination factor [Chelatococcus asaccharovorans]CAH1668703.1 Transcription antitermination protein NusB [Chelatococcus asaccharovorans]CAH1679883.1 Transcription antitermination protein NusB [Chelatococcus asaccharovorans]
MSEAAVSKGERRSAARLAAVQALYEMDVAGTGVIEAVAQFEAHWMGQEIDGVSFKPAEAAFFRDIVAGVVREQKSVDRKVDAALAKGWPLTRVEIVLRAVLRAGCYELMFRKDVPVRVVISEYVDVSRAFYSDDEPGFVNAVLDAVAREVRPGELAPRA